MAEDPASRFGKPFHVSRFTFHEQTPGSPENSGWKRFLGASSLGITVGNVLRLTRNGLQISRITGMISGRRDVFFAM